MASPFPPPSASSVSFPAPAAASASHANAFAPPEKLVPPSQAAFLRFCHQHALPTLARDLAAGAVPRAAAAGQTDAPAASPASLPPYRIVDYGSAQGTLGMPFVQGIIDCVRTAQPDRNIEVSERQGNRHVASRHASTSLHWRWSDCSGAVRSQRGGGVEDKGTPLIV